MLVHAVRVAQWAGLLELLPVLIAGVAEPRADWLWRPRSQVHDRQAASADGGRAYGRRAQVRSLAASAACKQFLRAHLVPRECPGLPSCCLCSTPQQARPGPLMRASNFSPANFELLLLKPCGCFTPFLSQRARGGCVHSGHVSVLPGIQPRRHRRRWVGWVGLDSMCSVESRFVGFNGRLLRQKDLQPVVSGRHKLITAVVLAAASHRLLFS